MSPRRWLPRRPDALTVAAPAVVEVPAVVLSDEATETARRRAFWGPIAMHTLAATHPAENPTRDVLAAYVDRVVAS